ncbi:hypothetical protein FIBSPDRAFT_964502 [Athelia psychrophila]|uniref:Uncharacterized protein n=1 Tax=Athelia psychrophila TaxID=1759441 RepID=A0A165XQ77_9AGAM|nr:hypothetical protein FIBSPDRAFT_964502 [Fibularhizoctonia sp. CBS 109695]
MHATRFKSESHKRALALRSPPPTSGSKSGRGLAPKALGQGAGVVVKTIVVLPIDLSPFVDVSVQVYFNTLANAQYLDNAVILQVHESAVLVERCKWEYRSELLTSSSLIGQP